MIVDFDPHQRMLDRANFSMEESAPSGELLSHPEGGLLAVMLAGIASDTSAPHYRPSLSIGEVATSSIYKLYIDRDTGWAEIKKGGPFINPEVFLAHSWYINYLELRTPLVHTVDLRELGGIEYMGFILGGGHQKKCVESGLVGGTLVPMNSEEVRELTTTVDTFFVKMLDKTRRTAE